MSLRRNYLTGKIDEVRILDKKLSSTYINNSYLSQPLSPEYFPEQSVDGISGSKLDALRDLTYDELRKTIGEGYKFRIEISES